METLKTRLNKAINLLVLAGLVLSWFTGSAAASAPSSSIPKQADFTPTAEEAFLLVAKGTGPVYGGGTSGIWNQKSTVKIYSLIPDPTITIEGFGQCDSVSGGVALGLDAYNPGPTEYHVYNTDESPGDPSLGTNFNVSNNGSCATDTYSRPIASSTKSVVPGHENYYVWVFEANLLIDYSVGPAWNGFKVSTSSGFIGYSKLAGDQFAIKKVIASNDLYEYNFSFAPDCTLTGPGFRDLRWYDADVGQPNQSVIPSFTITDETTGISTFVTNSDVSGGFGGNNIQRTYPYLFTPDHLYTWTWHDIDKYNAVQFNLPFDSIYYQLPCVRKDAFDLVSQVTISPPIAFPGDTVTVDYSVCNTESEAGGPFSKSPPPNRGTSAPTNITTSGALNPGISTTQTIPKDLSGCWSATSNLVVPASSPVGSEICAALTSSLDWGNSDGTGLGGAPEFADDCVTVSDGPYLQVLGHDTWAGGGFLENGVCNIVGPGNITARALAAAGAMDQYAAFARGDVNGFGTANTPLGTTLTFANTPTLGDFAADRCLANLFDGIAGGPGDVIDDALWNNSTNNLGSLNSNISSEQHTFTGTASYNNAGTQLQNYDEVATILINGDFHISGNITLNTNPNLSVGDLPLLVFIVGGNIFIDHSVTQLDGIYIAYGEVDTCSDGSPGSLSPVTALSSGPDCNEHLEINGSLIAKDIAFRRTHGGTNEGATGTNLTRCRATSSPFYLDNNRRCAAETIIWHPWMWLAEPIFDRGETSTASQYPIQQLKDLPPIY